jgi:ATP-dependent DNA ligase
MALPIKSPFEPMESRAVTALPVGTEWQYEPKWDGFRCLAFRDGDRLHLQSKSGQPLARYFPDVVEVLTGLAAKKFVMDGEIVIPVGGSTSFNLLLQRVHPAASRVRKLAAESPALLIVFDLLVDEAGRNLTGESLQVRRQRLENFAGRFFRGRKQLRLSPVTTKLITAKRWASPASGLEGVMAKQLDLPYLAGSRDAMQKLKHHRSADCVVGGIRYAEGTKQVGSLLLGLYDEQGLLNHVGFTAAFSVDERKQLTKQLKPLMGGKGFTGKAPGGPSRWNSRRSAEWHPLKPRLVVEVEFDNFTGERFRHGTRLVRFRPDKSPRQCTYEQVRSPKSAALKLLRRGVSASKK